MEENVRNVNRHLNTPHLLKQNARYVRARQHITDNETFFIDSHHGSRIVNITKVAGVYEIQSKNQPKIQLSLSDIGIITFITIILFCTSSVSTYMYMYNYVSSNWSILFCLYPENTNPFFFWLRQELREWIANVRPSVRLKVF